MNAFVAVLEAVAPIAFAIAAIVVSAYSLDLTVRAMERRRGEPVARALHPVTRSKQLPDVDDAGRWVR